MTIPKSHQAFTLAAPTAAWPKTLSVNSQAAIVPSISAGFSATAAGGLADQPSSPAPASASPFFSSFAEALSIWAVDVRIAFASAPATASAPSCS